MLQLKLKADMVEGLVLEIKRQSCYQRRKWHV